MKTIGIMGGMGPMATVDLMQKVIVATKAIKDQEHIHTVIDNNTNIPDRSECIFGKGPSPVPEMVKSAGTTHRHGSRRDHHRLQHSPLLPAGSTETG